MKSDEFLRQLTRRLNPLARDVIAPELSHSPMRSGEPTLAPAPLGDIFREMAAERALAAVSMPAGFPTAQVGFEREGRRFMVGYNGIEGRESTADAFAEAAGAGLPIAEVEGPHLLRLVQMGHEDAYDAARQIDITMDRQRFAHAWDRGLHRSRARGGAERERDEADRGLGDD